MRVAVITESFLPSVNGVSHSVLQVIAHLRRHGHQAMVVAPGPGPSHVPDVEGVPVVRVPAVDVPMVDSLPIGVPTPVVRAAIEEFRPDVIHAASPFVLGARGVTVGRRLGIPTVAVYQTDVAGFAASYGIGLTARAAWRWTRRVHAAADRTLAPSRWAVEALQEHGVPRVHRWGRGVDTDRFRPSRRSSSGATALRAHLAPDGEMIVGYVGRLAHEKQVERLAALSGIAGVRVVVVGDGPARERLAAALPDAVFLGFRGGTELAETYAALDAFVHTGPFETFCQTVQEAQASGVPVLAPDAGGVADLVAPGRTGWLFPTAAGPDAAHLRARIEHWRDDPDRRREMGHEARAAVQGRTWPRVCDELLGHYEDLTGADRSGGLRRRAA